MKIQVTQNDIDNGIPKSDCSCPVALALRRQWNPTAVVVGSIFIKDRNNSILSFYENPLAVKLFIRDFDDLKPVKPFSFDIPTE